MDEYILPNSCYDYRFDIYEDGILRNEDEREQWEAEMEDRLYEQNRDEC